MVAGGPEIPQVRAQNITGIRLKSDCALVFRDGRGIIDERATNHAVIGGSHVYARVGEHIGLAVPTNRKGVRVSKHRALKLKIAVIHQLHIFCAGSDRGQREHCHLRRHHHWSDRQSKE